MRKANILDKVIEYIAPRAGRRRAQERFLIDCLATRNYSAADRGRRTEGWLIRMNRDPNAELARSLPLLQERAQDLIRNNSWALSIINEIVANLVHYGITASFSREGARDDDETAGDVPPLWMQWAETTQCDILKRKNFYIIQRLVARTWAAKGECFVRRIWRADWKPGEIPFALQVIPPEFIDHSKDGRDNVKLGMKLDDWGVVVGYYVYRNHPSESMFNGESILVDARDMIHVYSEDWPGQLRGIPLLTNSTLRLHDLDEFEDAELKKQGVAAMFAGYRKKRDDYGAPTPSFGQDNSGKDKSRADTVTDYIEPGAIETLAWDEDIVFANPPQRTGYSDYVKQNLLAVSASTGTTYEGATGDYGGVTFLNGRMGLLRFHRHVDQWQYLMIIPQFCQRAAEWFLEGAKIAGQDLSNIQIDWQPPVKHMVDPSREIPAEREEVRMGAKTQFELIRSRGNDPIQFLKERRREQRLLDKYGVLVTTDVRKVSGAGQLQSTGTQSGQGSDKTDEENGKEAF